MLKALVIDDEQLAREELTELLHATGKIEVIDQASNAIEGLKKINLLKPDIIFLDIQMPVVTGIELLAMLDPDTMPTVVFVTAFEQYALQAFEDNAFDYLLKPIEIKRLEKTVYRLVKQHKKEREKQDLSTLAPDYLEQIPCIGLNRIILIHIKDVECVYSNVTGVHIHNAEQTASSQLTLKVLENKTDLLRCHRQYLVNTKAIKEIKLLENGLAEITTLSGYKVPVSRRHLRILKERLGII